MRFDVVHGLSWVVKTLTLPIFILSTKSYKRGILMLLMILFWTFIIEYCSCLRRRAKIEIVNNIYLKKNNAFWYSLSLLNVKYLFIFFVQRRFDDKANRAFKKFISWSMTWRNYIVFYGKSILGAINISIIYLILKYIALLQNFGMAFMPKT